jgi:RHH-type rel operon transcriptional repressor/antitoxin RelB
MEVQFTPEQEERLVRIAGVEGVAPARLVQDAALRLIEEDADDLEDLRIAEQRLIELRAGRSRTHSLEEVERDLGLVD